jgi:HTH-type transcriptional regulator / antitoxin HigA
MEGRLMVRTGGDAMATKAKNAGKRLSAKDHRNTVPRGLADKNGASTQFGSKSKHKIATLAGIDPTYLMLIARFPLRPIRTDTELEKAVDVIDELVGREDLSAADADYLDVLGDLVEKFVDEHVVTPPVSDGAMLLALMAEKGISQADVVRETGISKTVLSLVLHGKRGLTREHIVALARYFLVTPAVFRGLP